MVTPLATARGEVVVDSTPREVRYALIQNMTKRGYEVAGESERTVYIIYLGVTYGPTLWQCDEQKFKFVLRPEAGRTAINGFAVCYARPRNLIYDTIQTDNIILDAFKK